MSNIQRQDIVEKFIAKFPKYRWHNDLINCLDELYAMKDINYESVFNMKELSEKIQVQIPTLRNYFKLLETLHILEWRRFTGKKGPQLIVFIKNVF
jgi:hypothetical protein